MEDRIASFPTFTLAIMYPLGPLQPMSNILSSYICSDCHTDMEDFVSSSAIGLEVGVEPPPDFGPCAVCGNELSGDTCYELTHVRCSDEIADKITLSIFACDDEGCGRVWDSEDDEWVIDETNETLLFAFADVVEASHGDDGYSALLRKLNLLGLLESVEVPDIKCPKCGSALSGWFQEVKVERLTRILPTVPTLPEEITALATSQMLPAELIEYYRSDCSNSLIHLTKGARLEHLRSNVAGGRSKRFTAQEVLYFILAQKTLRAHAGKGLREPTVCFTEKPLTAVKDTLLGKEAQVRGERRSLKWAPYGLMFSKDYLRGFGVSPVLHMNPGEGRSLPGELQHRIVQFSDRVNWNHEREWRCSRDIAFDPAEAVVLVPRFEHIAPFQSALRKQQIVVRGFLPLLDLFACM